MWHMKYKIYKFICTAPTIEFIYKMNSHVYCLIKFAMWTFHWQLAFVTWKSQIFISLESCHPHFAKCTIEMVWLHRLKYATCWGQGWWVCCPASPRLPPPVSEFPPGCVWSTAPPPTGPPHTGNHHWCSLPWYLKLAKI